MKLVKPHEDKDLRREWFDIWSQNIDIAAEGEETKSTFLGAIYAQLYSELRDKERNQQQLVTWALTILTSSGLFSMLLTEEGDLFPAAVFSFMLLGATWILTDGIRALVDDRMSIGRQLDRIHRIMGGFTKGYYYAESMLFDPIWYGWGFEPERDSNVLLGRRYRALIWALCVFDIVIVFSKSAMFKRLMANLSKLIL